MGLNWNSFLDSFTLGGVFNKNRILLVYVPFALFLLIMSFISNWPPNLAEPFFLLIFLIFVHVFFSFNYYMATKKGLHENLEKIKDFFSFFEKIELGMSNKFPDTKIDYPSLLSTFLLYVLVTFLLFFFFVKDLYLLTNISDLSSLIPFFVLLLFKIFLAVEIVKKLTLTRSEQDIFSSIVVGIVLSDLFVFLIYFFSFEEFKSYFLELLTLVEPTYFAVILVLFVVGLLFYFRMPLFETGDGEPFMKKFIVGFFVSSSSFIVGILPLLRNELHILHPVQQGYLMKESFIILFLIFLLLSFYFKLSDCLELMKEKEKPFKYESYEIIGHAYYSHKYTFFSKYTLPKSIKFFIGRNSSKEKEEVYIHVPKKSSIFNNQLIVGDSIKVLGSYQKVKNINSKEDFEQVVPLFIKIEKQSPLRNFRIGGMNNS